MFVRLSSVGKKLPHSVPWSLITASYYCGFLVACTANGFADHWIQRYKAIRFPRSYRCLSANHRRACVCCGTNLGAYLRSMFLDFDARTWSLTEKLDKYTFVADQKSQAYLKRSLMSSFEPLQILYANSVRQQEFCLGRRNVIAQSKSTPKKFVY